MLCVCFLTVVVSNPVRADKAHRVFVVVPSLDERVDSSGVEACVAGIKAERERFGVASEVLPILRINPEAQQQMAILRSLGVNQTSQLQLLLCRRRADGWPDRLSGLYSGEFAVRDAMREALGLAPMVKQERSQGGVSPLEKPLTEIGLLLTYRHADSQAKASAEAFLEELGRYWTQRYGRVRPVPYPLGHYNLTDPETERRVFRAFPELGEVQGPSISLCLFDQGRPRKILEVFDDLELPATLVRRISSSRTKHLAVSVELPASSGEVSPVMSEVSFAMDEQQDMSSDRMHEIARQLWSRAEDGPKGENRVTRRLLLVISELTRVGLSRSKQEEQQLFDALEDYQAEPLILPSDSELTSLQEQLLQIVEQTLSGQ